MRQVLLLCGLAALPWLGCGGGEPVVEKAQGSAIWVAADTPFGFAEIGQLEGSGVTGTFVEAGRLTWNAGRPRLEPIPTFSLPRAVGVTLVVSGDWPSGEIDSAGAAAALAEGLTTVAAAAKGRNLEARGYHFDVDCRGRLRSCAEVLGALRNGLSGKQRVSVDIDRRALEDEDLERLAESVDLLVPWLYGPAPGEPDDRASWKLERLEGDLKQLEKLDTDYLVGVNTLAQAVALARGAEAGPAVTRFSLGQFVRDPALELARGFTLEGVNRLVYTFQAQRAVRVAGLDLARGQGVRVSGLAASFLEELQRRLAAQPLDHRLGEAYYRMPRPEERMTVSVATLARALSEQSAGSPLVVALESVGGRRYRVRVTNVGDEQTDIVTLGNNFVEVRAQGGTVGRVDAGDFHRWELLRDAPNGELVREFRAATVLRLFTPLLEAGETRTSGVFEVSGTPQVRASFVLPGGSLAEAVPTPAVSGAP